MQNIIQDQLDRDNQTTPKHLVIHCPSISQRAPWDEWAASTLEWLTARGWVAARIGSAVHVCPAHLGVSVH